MGGKVYRVLRGVRGSWRALKAGVEGHKPTGGLVLEPLASEGGGASRNPKGAVKCVDIRRNTGGEGGLLDRN